MKTQSAGIGLVLSVLLCTSGALAATRTYQVTGPIIESNDKVIVIQKGKDRWELERTAGTKINGNIKPGEKVTISYTMIAGDVEVKAAGAAKTHKKAK